MFVKKKVDNVFASYACDDIRIMSFVNLSSPCEKYIQT